MNEKRTGLGAWVRRRWKGVTFVGVIMIAAAFVQLWVGIPDVPEKAPWWSSWWRWLSWRLWEHLKTPMVVPIWVLYLLVLALLLGCLRWLVRAGSKRETDRRSRDQDEAVEAAAEAIPSAGPQKEGLPTTEAEEEPARLFVTQATMPLPAAAVVKPAGKVKEELRRVGDKYEAFLRTGAGTIVDGSKISTGKLERMLNKEYPALVALPSDQRKETAQEEGDISVEWARNKEGQLYSASVLKIRIHNHRERPIHDVEVSVVDLAWWSRSARLERFGAIPEVRICDPISSLKPKGLAEDSNLRELVVIRGSPSPGFQIQHVGGRPNPKVGHSAAGDWLVTVQVTVEVRAAGGSTKHLTDLVFAWNGINLTPRENDHPALKAVKEDRNRGGAGQS